MTRQRLRESFGAMVVAVVIVQLMASHVFAKMDMTRFYSQYFIGVREKNTKAEGVHPFCC